MLDHDTKFKEPDHLEKSRQKSHLRGRFLTLIAGWACLGLTWVVPGAVPVIPLTVKTSIRQRVDYGYCAGISVGMVNDEGRTFFNYGQTSYESGTTPDENTLYEIGSITKVFTSALLADMTARGEVALSDGVETLLPRGFSIPEWGGEAITLRHLSTHTSGLPTNPPFDEVDPVNPFAGFTAGDLQDFLTSYALTRAPGTEWDYSNLGVGLLGHALALRLEMDYEAALRQRILGPLGLVDTAISLSEAQWLRRASGHSGVVARPPFDMASLEGAGSLVSSASDLLTFLEYQLQLRPTDLSPAIQETQKTWFTTPTFGMGLGWLIIPAGATPIYIHDGATMGQTAFAGFNPASKTGVVVLTNVRINKYSGVTDIGVKLLVPAATLTTITRPAEVPVETLRKYFGRFVANDGKRFDVGVLHQHLTFAYSEDHGTVFTVYPQSDRRFLMLEATTEATATFQLDVNQAPVSMTWTQSGQSATYYKQSLPSRLRIQPLPGQVQLILTGDTGIEYSVEATEDFKQWREIATTTIWDEPVIDLPDPPTAHRFYRARKLE